MVGALASDVVGFATSVAETCAFFPFPGGGGWYVFSLITTVSDRRHMQARTAYLLLCFWFGIWIGIGEPLNVLPILVRIERLLDWVE